MQIIGTKKYRDYFAWGYFWEESLRNFAIFYEQKNEIIFRMKINP